MTNQGRYGDDRTFALPDGWAPLSDEVVGTATGQALAALAGAAALGGVARYYDRTGSYAGTLFLDARPNDPYSIEASDLYAVTTLSIKLDARHGRLLLDEGDDRMRVHEQLRSLDPDLPITDLERGQGGSAGTLTRMYELHSHLRDLLAGDSNRWVTAAKICARKRPRLFPVRDNAVCRYLAGGRPLKRGDGWPGDFSVDIQIYANLMTNPTVVDELTRLRRELEETRGGRPDDEDLRMLDTALWMAANRHPRA